MVLSSPIYIIVSILNGGRNWSVLIIVLRLVYVNIDMVIARWS